jgi:hypothetical protein
MGKKKTFSTSIDETRIKELKHLAVDTDKSLGKLLEEAIEDICKKYKKKFSTRRSSPDTTQ